MEQEPSNSSNTTFCSNRMRRGGRASEQGVAGSPRQGKQLPASVWQSGVFPAAVLLQARRVREQSKCSYLALLYLPALPSVLGCSQQALSITMAKIPHREKGKREPTPNTWPWPRLYGSSMLQRGCGHIPQHRKSGVTFK